MKELIPTGESYWVNDVLTGGSRIAICLRETNLPVSSSSGITLPSVGPVLPKSSVEFGVEVDVGVGAIITGIFPVFAVASPGVVMAGAVTEIDAGIVDC